MSRVAPAPSRPPEPGAQLALWWTYVSALQCSLGRGGTQRFVAVILEPNVEPLSPLTNTTELFEALKS